MGELVVGLDTRLVELVLECVGAAGLVAAGKLVEELRPRLNRLLVQ